jgi:very-short-patch-repair endonuclease
MEQPTISARTIMKSLGYSNWQNFDIAIRRTIGIISTGAGSGTIKQVTKPVTVGSGATRYVLDYLFDSEAFDLLVKVIAPYKLVNAPGVRNEAVLLSLLRKYCNLKDIPFEFQYHLGGYVFDAYIDNHTLIEFDEPSHQMDKKRLQKDARKEAYARSHGFKILRFDLTYDIVDMIVEVERHLSAYVTAAYRTSHTA